jgi:hypothetical protein
MTATRDPSPEEIRLACLLIQATWTPDEKMKRLRSDLRPTFTRCDGVTETMDADVYEGHHERRAELQAMAPPPAGAKGTSGF